MEIIGQLLPPSQNVLYRARLEGQEIVYRPATGQINRPDIDFDGLNHEFAAWLISDAMGWDVVPVTNYCQGPDGWGIAQRWIERDPGRQVVHVVPRGLVPDNWLLAFSFKTRGGEQYSQIHLDHPDLRRIAILDVVIDNANRRPEHVIVDVTGAVHAIGHWWCFHGGDPTPGTVLWGWAGSEFSDEELRALEQLLARLDEGGEWFNELSYCMAEDTQWQEIQDRVQALLDSGVLPRPEGKVGRFGGGTLR